MARFVFEDEAPAPAPAAPAARWVFEDEPAPAAAPAAPPEEPGFLSRAASFAWNMVKPGQYFRLPPPPPRKEGESDRDYALRSSQATFRWAGSPEGMSEGMRLLGYTMPGGAPSKGVASPGPIAQRLDQAAIMQGRKALSGIGTALAARKPIPEAVVRQALDTGAIKPLGTIAGTAARLERGAEALGDQYSAILSELEAQGVTGPNAVLLAHDLTAKAQQAAQTSLGSARPKILADAAAELPTKVSPVPFASKDLGLMQAEEIKRQLQFEAQREYDKIARQYTTAGETKKELAAFMRQAIEDSVQAQASKAPEAAAAFEPVKNRLANTLAALRVAEEGAARAARRKPISLSSTITGSAAGAASGSPLLGLLAAVGHGVVDSRLASTLATLAYGGSKGANALARLSGPPSASQAAAVGLNPELAALLNALRGRPGFSPAAAEDDR